MPTSRRIFWALLLTLCVATSARAGSITVVWDPNIEPDLAGYMVSYGRTPGWSEAMIDVGPTTAWTFTDATPGTTYYFRVYAYNQSGFQSAASVEVSAFVLDGSGPAVVSVNRGRLNFGAVRSGTTVTGATPAQTIVVTQNSATPATWSVSPSAAWMRVTPASGTGTGTFTVQLVTASVPAAGTYDGSVTISANGGTSVQILPVRLQVYSTGTSHAPFGAFDTPVDGTMQVTGAIPVTGWAMDDVQVSMVQIFRDPVLGEPGLVYLGDATFVAGARPDVESGFPDWPNSDRGGWGFMLLTNMLPDTELGAPNGGNGTFQLHAYAVDAEGLVADLGSKTITANNRTADKPFGTIDTPTQGGTASGSAFVNFGWAIAPGGSIPADGSTITVLVDGAAMGHPTYNNFRTDIAAAFPGYANSNGAIGFFILDTTQLTNGLHTISWVASDSNGNTSGLGSRFFNVLNGSPGALTQAGRRSSQSAAATRAGTSSSLSAETIAALPVENTLVEVQRLAETDKTREFAMPEWTGEIRIRTRESEPLELLLANQFTDGAGGRYEGYLIVGGEPRALPPGSSLDAAAGTFRWQPGAGFVGSYQLVFVRTLPGGSQSRIPVRVRIVPKFDGEPHDRRR